MSQTSRTFVSHTGEAKTSGFTLAEVLVIISVLGVLTAIAAPSFIRFINRLRVKTVQGAVYQALQTVRNQARAQKVAYCATFGMKSEVPKFAIHQSGSSPTLWESFNFEIKSGQVTLFTIDAEEDRICFDYRGNTEHVYATVVMQIPDADDTRLCVEVENLLGTLRKDRGSNCPGSPEPPEISPSTNPSPPPPSPPPLRPADEECKPISTADHVETLSATDECSNTETPETSTTCSWWSCIFWFLK